MRPICHRLNKKEIYKQNYRLEVPPNCQQHIGFYCVKRLFVPISKGGNLGWGERKQQKPRLLYKINYSNKNSPFEKLLTYALYPTHIFISASKPDSITAWISLEATWLSPVGSAMVSLCCGYNGDSPADKKQWSIFRSGGGLLFTCLNVNC